MIRVGVVADTHCPEFIEELPPAVFDRLRGVDLILHAGDVGGQATLERLREIAPVEAVRGDHDSAMRHLPLRRQIEVGGRQIAIIHGNRRRLIEEPVTFAGTMSLGRLHVRPGWPAWLRRQFPEAEVVVYGHTHQARVDRVDGALLFNPGPVYQVTAREAERRLDRGPNWFEWCWLQVIRHRLDLPVTSVGLLEVGDRVTARVLPLA